MNQVQEYILNRLIQATDSDKPWALGQLGKWKALDKYFHRTPLSRDEKLDFIRSSLSSWCISDTTLDIVFRRMIRWTLPSWVSLELLSIPKPNGYLRQLVWSESKPGLFYTVSEEKCNCPGFRGNNHCKHHDDFIEELQLPSKTEVDPEEVVA